MARMGRAAADGAAEKKMTAVASVVWSTRTDGLCLRQAILLCPAIIVVRGTSHPPTGCEIALAGVRRWLDGSFSGSRSGLRGPDERFHQKTLQRINPRCQFACALENAVASRLMPRTAEFPPSKIRGRLQGEYAASSPSGCVQTDYERPRAG